MGESNQPLKQQAKRKAKELINEIMVYTWNGQDNKDYSNAVKAALVAINYALEYTSLKRGDIVAYDPFLLLVKEFITNHENKR
jgi:hypothetical protein